MDSVTSGNITDRGTPEMTQIGGSTSPSTIHFFINYINGLELKIKIIYL